MDIPTVGSASGRAGNLYENLLANSPLASATMEKARVKAGEGVYDAVRRMTGGGADLRGAEDLGRFAQQAAMASKEAFQQRSSQAYEGIFDAFGGAPASLKHTVEAVRGMTEKLSPTAGKALERRLNGLISDELDDAASGALNLNTLKAARTRLDHLLKQPGTASTMDVSQGQISAIKTAMTRDLEEGLEQNAGKDVFNAWKEANSEYARQSAARAKADASIFGKSIPLDAQKVGERLLRTDLSPETVEALKTILDPQDFTALRTGILMNSGRPLASSSDNAADFIAPAQLAKMIGNGRGSFSQGTQEALWGDIPKMKALRLVTESLAQNARNANTSKTAVHQQFKESLNGLLPIVPLLSGLGTLDKEAIASSLMAFSQPIGAKLTTSPGMIRYLAKPQSAASKWAVGHAPLAGVEGGLLGVYGGRN